MLCPMKGDGTPISCTAAYQKWTGQPRIVAGSKNPTTLVVWSVKKDKGFELRFRLADCDLEPFFVFVSSASDGTGCDQDGMTGPGMKFSGAHGR